jgi:DNA polymerase III delta subunit
MKDVKIESILQLKPGQAYPFGTLLLLGEELYLERELKELFKKSGSEIKEVEVKKSGPESSWEDLSMGTSLFCSSQILWVKKVGAPSQWTKNALGVWARMKERADGRQFTMVLQGPMDKRLSYAALELDTKSVLPVDASQKKKWIKMIAEKRNFAISAEQLKFLSENFDEPLLIYDQWIDLWQLGGDFWAEAQLGWRSAGGAVNSSQKKKMSTYN